MKDLILKRDDKGRWFVRPYLGTNVITKQPLRPSKLFPDAVDEEEARRAAEAWAAGISKATQLNVRRRVDDLLPRYVMWLKDTGAPVNTVKTYRSSANLLAPFFEGMDPDEVTSFDVELVYITLQRDGGKRGHPLSNNTICRHHGFLASAWAWMLAEGICTTSPMPYVHKPSREKTLAVAFSDAERDVLLDELLALMADDAADDDAFLKRNLATLAYTSALSGIREGEACGLDRGDVVARLRKLIVSATAVDDQGESRRQEKTKGRKTRNVPASADLLDVLEVLMRWQDAHLPRRLRKLKPSKVPLFFDAKGKRLNPTAVSKWFSALCEDLGLPPECHFHTLRHTFASVLLDEGYDLRTIAELLGHVREGFTLETYTHMMPGRDQQAVEAFATVARRPRGRGP